MKFVISTQELNVLINKCFNVVSTKATTPILGNFLVEAKGNELTITATDLKLGIQCHTEANVIKEGATTLPARRFAQLIKELTSVNVEISTNENEITEVIADSSKFKLHGMNSNEFPALPSIEESMQFKVDQATLKDMLYRTAFSVSREDNRYALTGVLMRIAQGTAWFAGTDGKRLARSHTSLDIDPAFAGSYIIPFKAVEEISKNLGGEGEATVSLMEDKISVEVENTRVITKLLTGDYPDVNRIVPEKTERVISLHREELMTLLRQISLFTDQETQSVRFTFSDGEMKLKANTMEVGEGDVSMPVNYHGDPLEVAFNPNYFLDILRHTKGETVNMAVSDSFNPGIVTDQEQLPEKTEAVSPLFVLMPMRLSEDT